MVGGGGSVYAWEEFDGGVCVCVLQLLYMVLLCVWMRIEAVLFELWAHVKGERCICKR